MPASGVLRGVDGRVTINSTNVNAEEYEHADQADDIPAIGFEDVDAPTGITFDDGATGVVGANVSFKGYWDLNLNPHTDPPKIKVGQRLTGCKLYLQKGGTKCFTYSILRLLSTRVGAQLRGRVDLQVQSKTGGPFTWPS